MIKKHNSRLAIYGRKFIFVSAGILLISQLGLGSLPVFAAEPSENQAKSEDLMDASLRLGMLRNVIMPQASDPITTEADLKAAIDNASESTESSPVKITLGDAIKLENPITVSGNTRHILLQSQNGQSTVSREDVNNESLFSVSDSASLTLENVMVDGGNMSGKSLITVDNARFDLNKGSSITKGGGGAINAINGATVNITDSDISDNKSTEHGGAIYADNAKVNLTSSTISKNTTDSLGGGIYAENSAEINVTSSTINENVGGSSGGGLHARNNAEINVEAGSMISQNSADRYGGGLVAREGAVINVNGGTIRDNTTGMYGGGIYVIDGGTANVKDGQIISNKVTEENSNGSNIYLGSASENNPATLTTTGGVIYNEKNSKVDSIYSSGSYVKWDGLEQTAMTIERNENPTTNNYTPETNVDLVIKSENSASGQWSNRGGISGIAYKNESNEGFFKVNGVMVRYDVTDQLVGKSDDFTYNSYPQGLTSGHIQGYNLLNFGALSFQYADAGSEDYDHAMPSQVGNYQAKFETAGGDTYNPYKATAATPLTIKKATPTQADFTYPEKPMLAYRNEGWDINKEIKAKDATLTNYTVSYIKDGKETTTMKETGSYQIKITVGNNTNFNNNSFTISGATVTIYEEVQPEPLQFYADMEDSYVYNGMQPSIKITSNKEELGEIKTIIKQADNETTSSDIGEYQVYARNNETENYPALDTLVGTFSITEKSLKVSVKDVVIMQDTVLPTPTINYDGLVAEQTEDDLFSTLPTVNYESDGKTAGTFEISLDQGVKTAVGNNYTVEYVSGSLTVNPTTNPDPDPNPSDPDRLPLYRVYNKNDGEHLYTLSRPEAQGLINLGWQDEGIGWYGGETTGIAAYRLYNPNSGEHFYTLDRAEYDSVGQAGWNKEGIAFYAAENTEIPIHRLFNPNARDAGSHHYTLSLAENAHLIREGWRSEGVGFFGK